MVAAIPLVRQTLLNLQRNFAAHPPKPAKGAILDGRDIGSVVCPAAEFKLFVTASAKERARRRRDIERGAAPLIIAPDATTIDTTTLDANAVFERASNLIARAIKEKEWQQ